MRPGAESAAEKSSRHYLHLSARMQPGHDPRVEYDPADKGKQQKQKRRIRKIYNG